MISLRRNRTHNDLERSEAKAELIKVKAQAKKDIRANKALNIIKINNNKIKIQETGKLDKSAAKAELIKAKAQAKKDEANRRKNAALNKKETRHKIDADKIE